MDPIADMPPSFMMITWIMFMMVTCIINTKIIGMSAISQDALLTKSTNINMVLIVDM
jgi:hypothetical protein